MLIERKTSRSPDTTEFTEKETGNVITVQVTDSAAIIKVYAPQGEFLYDVSLDTPSDISLILKKKGLSHSHREIAKRILEFVTC